MSFIKGREEKTSSDPAIPLEDLTQCEIVQEILIKDDGNVEIPWITPQASRLVLELWEELNNGKSFGVTVRFGNIYCG